MLTNGIMRMRERSQNMCSDSDDLIIIAEELHTINVLTRTI